MSPTDSDINRLVERILAFVADPSLRTEGGGTFPVSEVYPPVEEDLINLAEASLGFALPELVRQCYLRVGNGGFGPGHGMIGLRDGYPDDLSGACLPDLYHHYKQDADNPWPDRLLPLFVVGCGLVDSIDCSAPGCPVVRMAGMKRTETSLYEWLEVWVTRSEELPRSVD
jgi:hypothetical protein